LAEFSSVACDQVGLYLSNQKVITPDTNYFTLSNITPQVVTAKGEILLDSINWVEIQGSFIANGNEKFLTIGIFVPNDSIKWLYRHYWWLPWCEYFVDEVYIYQSSLPINAVAGNDTLVCIGDSLLLGVYNYTDEHYQWTSDEGFFSKEARPVVNPQHSTRYYLKLINFKQEVSYDTICVYVEECFEPPVIPNVFTPNGDGINDVLEILNPGNYPYSMYIYNRWGKLIFTGNESRAWDGCENGNPASESVYFFSLKLEHPQFRKEYSGSVQLMR
jgi:gliding motility-associated-like protein